MKMILKTLNVRAPSLLLTFVIALFKTASSAAAAEYQVIDEFDRQDTLYHGHAWETLNPGYWKIQEGSLRRRLVNNGNGNPITNFPWHWSTGGKEVEPRSGDRTPNLPPGMIWRRDWDLTGNYSIRTTFTVVDQTPAGRGEPDGFLGVCFGGESLYESRNFRGAKPGAASWMALWKKSGRFGIYEHLPKITPLNEGTEIQTCAVADGDQVRIELEVSGPIEGQVTVKATWEHDDTAHNITIDEVDRSLFADGYFGLAAYGVLDFEVNQVELAPGENQIHSLDINELHVCYPLGDTLRMVGEDWSCKFVALFRSGGERVAVRVADTPQPQNGWSAVPISGSADIVDNEWRRFTSVIEVNLPRSPAEQTLYYTVWKDGVDVTEDPRPAEPEFGYLGRNNYVGRLPRLAAPYRVCTLGGHALHGGGTTLPRAETYQRNWIHGQPTQDAYKYFEDYDFQIVNWDDDVWYLELLFPPPSTDDAYKIVNLTIGNPTTRWQMMRHWNVINPGDHDYGMDDIKGPEQIRVRQLDDIGQDSEYMRRNYDINHHLTQGLETRIGDANPKDWRQWKMPNGDFTLVVLESRNWRTSQDTEIWVNGGWGHKKNLYDRRDPTRTLLGEEQFAWLSELVRTDTSPLICLTGVNCMHPVFAGRLVDEETGYRFHQQDRVAADYAGWCTAGTDRLLQLLGSRPGIISVYGDIHLACTVENLHHRIIESSCGPIGRGGSRTLKKDWAPVMKDYDGRDVRIHALYHLQFDSPDLHKRSDTPMHWNFLEKEFDPRGKDPLIQLKIRNIIDPPTATPRGGGIIHRKASTTGRQPSATIQPTKTLPNAEVHFRMLDGRPILGTRSLANGLVPVTSLIDIAPGTKVLMTSSHAEQAEARILTTQPKE